MKKFFGMSVCLAMCAVGIFAFAGCGSGETGSLYSLKAAYDNGWLTKDDLMSIAYYHNSGRNYNESLIAEDFTPQPKTPATLSDEIEQGIKVSAAKYYRDHDIVEDAKADGCYIKQYYGSYNGCYCVILGQEYFAYPAVAVDAPVEVGGFTFYYSYPGDELEIKVWRANS